MIFVLLVGKYVVIAVESYRDVDGGAAEWRLRIDQAFSKNEPGDFQTSDSDTASLRGKSWMPSWRSHHPNEYMLEHGGNFFDKAFSPWNVFFEGLRQQTGTTEHKWKKLPRITRHMLEMRDGVKLSTIVVNPYPYEQKKGALL